MAGTTDYTVYILPFLVAANSYEGTVELIGLDSGSGGGAGGATGLPADVPLTDVPRSVVAVIDSGVNPYHAFYHAGSPIYSDAAPSAVSLPVLDDFGIGGDCAIELTRTGDFAADYQADLDSGLWEQAAACDMVWFVGTNVIAKSFGPGTRPFLPDDEGEKDLLLQKLQAALAKLLRGATIRKLTHGSIIVTCDWWPEGGAWALPA